MQRRLARLLPLLALVLAPEARSETYAFSTTYFNTPLPVTLSLSDVAGGVQVQVSITPSTGDDLIGLFGNVTSESLLAGMGVTPIEGGAVSQWQFGPQNSVKKVGADNGSYPVVTFDWGVRFASPIVSSATFTLTGVTAAQLRNASTQGWVFAVRLASSATRPDGAVIALSTAAPTISLTSPASGAAVPSPVGVSGSFTGSGVSLAVNGVAASTSGTAWSASVPLADGPRTLTATAVNTSASVSTSLAVNVDSTGPVISIAAPTAGSLTSQALAAVSGTVADANAVASVSIAGEPYPVTSNAFSGEALLSEGANTIVVSALDALGNSGSASVALVLDSTPPSVTITSPPSGTITSASSALASGTFVDASALTSLVVNGAAATLGSGTFSASVPLASGANTISAVATDAAGNTGEDSITIHVGAASSASITAPASGAITSQASLAVSVDAPGATSVTVNGAAASFNGALWVATVSLAEGANTLTAIASNGFGSAQAQITVTRDTTAPVVTITVPPNGTIYTSSPIGVFGTVTDANPITGLRLNGNPIIPGNAFAETLALTLGSNAITVVATDVAGNVGQATSTVTLEGVMVAIDSPADFTSTTAASVAVSGHVNDGSATVMVNGVAAPLNGTSFSATVPLGSGTNTITATATAGAQVASASITVIRVANPPPAPPADPIATPLDPSVPTAPLASLAYLYSGANAVQTGVNPAVFDAQRAGAIRGRVLTRSGAPLPSVVVKVRGRPEYGQTITRADGFYDLAVNGGDGLLLSPEREGFATVFRAAKPSWRDTDVIEDVVMVARDATATAVNGASSAPFQVVRGRLESDALHTRRGTLLFPQGTVATAQLPGGGAQALSSYSVRITELTVGDSALNALPAEVPNGVDPTNVWDLSIDEAEAANATSVTFNQTIPLYVEATVAFQPGDAVPTVSLNESTGRWQMEPNGVALRVLSEPGGVAELDANGDGFADSAAQLAAHGITPAEQAELASLYAPGQVLRRYPIQHFSGRCGHSVSFPRWARPPGQKPAQGQPPDCDCKQGSVLRVAQQVWGESVELVGSPERLHYESGRTPGYLISHTLRIPLTDATPPAPLEKVGLTIELAGRRFRQEFPPAANQAYTFTWDGLDAFGRRPQGWQLARVAIDYFYFGFLDGRRALLSMQQAYDTRVGAWDARGAGIGGWTLASHHTYDPYSQVLYRGDGRLVNGAEIPVVLRNRQGRLASAGSAPPGNTATLTGLQFASPSVAAAPDGTFFVGDAASRRIYRVDPVADTITQIAQLPSSGGVAASIDDLAVGPDGAIYVASSPTHRVYRVTLAGAVTPYAGTGTNGFSGDGGPATAAQLGNPNGVAFGPDGALYISELNNNRVRRVAPDGTIGTYAGSGSGTIAGFPGPALAAGLSRPLSLAFGPDGSLYVGLNLHRVVRINPTGYAEFFAGNGAATVPVGTISVGDGGPATAAPVPRPSGLALGADGALYIATGGSSNAAWRVRRVGADGLIQTVFGNGSNPQSAPVSTISDGRIARGSPALPQDVALLPDGRLLVLDCPLTTSAVYWSLELPLPGFTLGDITVASEDGGELYRFSFLGRHLDTRDALTGAVLRTFSYTTGGALDAITDADGNVTRVLRNGSGSATGIEGPDGAVTALNLDANGYLRTIANPNGETVTATASGLGLVTSFARPGGAGVAVLYDALGGLMRETNLGGGFTAFGGAQTDTQRAVATQSALGVTDNVTVTYLPNGDVSDLRTGADGLATDIVTSPSGVETTTAPDGTIVARAERPDPRLGMASPIAASLAITTPGGLAFLRTQSRAITKDATTGALLTQTDTVAVNGRTSTVAYDAATAITTTTTPALRQLFDQIDARGRLVATQVAGLEAVGLGYDARGRLASLVQGAGASQRTVLFSYDAAGNLASVTDPLLRSVSFQYDLAGRVTRQVLPDARFIDFTYDARGNLASLTPPGQPAHVFRYTLRDEEGEYEPPDVVPGDPRTFFTYDLDKNLTRVDRPDGQAVVLGYDIAGRLATVTTPRGVTTQTYSPTTGNVASIVAPGNEALAFGYDGSLATATAWSGTVNGSVSQGYDDDFRVTAQLVNGGLAASFAYDLDGLLVQAGSELLTRDPTNGLLTGTTLLSTATAQTYNGFGELASDGAAFGAASVYANAYTRDKLGRMTREIETIQGATTTFDYGYDLAGRLTQVDVNGVAARAYAYDANGNRLSVTSSSGATTGMYDAQDRMLTYGSATYTYNAAGDLTSKTTPAGATQYAYDALGNLTQVNLPDGRVITYVIDGQNRRIGKKINGVLVQGWLYQDQLEPVAELDGAGNVTARFVYGSRPNIPDYVVAASGTYRIFSDHLGSPRLVVNASTGAVAQRLDYDEFGRVTQDTAPGAQPFGFAGGIYDADTGLVRFGARDYDAEAGRWTGKDPATFGGDGANLYQYVTADPINFIDPSGYLSWAEAVARYTSGQGGTVGVPFSEHDPGFAANDFPGFDDAVAGAPPGSSTPVNLDLGTDTNDVPGRVVARLVGVLSKNPDGTWAFTGCVSLDDNTWDFDPQDWGKRDPEGFPYSKELATMAGGMLPGKPFNIRFTGNRPVTAAGP